MHSSVRFWVGVVAAKNDVHEPKSLDTSDDLHFMPHPWRVLEWVLLSGYVGHWESILFCSNVLKSSPLSRIDTFVDRGLSMLRMATFDRESNCRGSELCFRFDTVETKSAKCVGSGMRVEWEIGSVWFLGPRTIKMNINSIRSCGLAYGPRLLTNKFSAKKNGPPITPNSICIMDWVERIVVLGLLSDYIRGDLFRGSNEDNPSPRRWRFRSVNLSEDNSVKCAQPSASRTLSRHSAKYRYRGPPSRGSSLWSRYRQKLGSQPLNLSVVTSVASLQCEVRTLSEGLSKHSDAVSALTDAVLRRSTPPSELRGLQRSACCGCLCHDNVKDLQELPQGTTGKRQMLSTPDSTPTGINDPPLDTEFPRNHLPKQRSRATKRGRTRNVVDLTQEDNLHKEVFPERSSKRNRSPAAGMRYYNHLAPVGEDGHVDLVELRMMLAFTPLDEMDIAGVELAVSTYIFSTDISKREVLVDIPGMRGDRDTLMSLVLNILVKMLCNGIASFNWFIPTSIVQAALLGYELSNGNLEAIKKDHIRSKVDKAIKIYVPMWYPGHWYLMIIDVPNKKLKYLDSYRREDQIE
ncbi:hypothetical protein PIB30_033952 [Stylosanthes scabra]|uniref:Ubiquitin-like protease family profile domain-containing protein n=1 Tax=Stylosanthes scabra TaxID=79078 RepID=A0ABU6QCD1_9FABA|nr:hypothetical protein [Stylosanthes scabra]